MPASSRSQRVSCHFPPSVFPVMLTFVMSRVAINVIRMIKLFGWEPRIAKQLNQKREEELVAIRRNRMLSMLNNLCK